MTVALDPDFPASFLWGASTAAHQVEGNNVNSDWWAREHASVTDVVEPSGDACDSYHRYREDIALLAELGFNAYRFSLEWSRIEPEAGYVSRASIEHYRRMVDTCHEFGLTPVVTLLHFTVPRWMAGRGDWLAGDAAERFARFTEAILPIVSEGVEWVCTINEPNMMAKTREGDGSRPSPLPGIDLEIAEVLVDAHHRARDILRSVSTIKSGWSVATQAFQAEAGCEEITRTYSYPREELFLEAAAGDDFIGVQAYTRTIIGPHGPRPVPTDAETTLMGWEYFPAALDIGVRNAWNVTGHVPVLVTENGIATADDSRRIAYTQAALDDLSNAVADGVDIRGYLHWSALDNYEWGTYRPTFGLIAVDRQTFMRTPKPSARWLGELARRVGRGPNTVHR